MLKMPAILLSTLLACNAQSFAEDVDNYLNNAPDISDNPSQLQSIPMLQSLRNLKQQESRAPYVHDLKTAIKSELYLWNHKIYRWWTFSLPLMQVHHVI